MSRPKPPPGLQPTDLALGFSPGSAGGTRVWLLGPGPAQGPFDLPADPALDRLVAAARATASAAGLDLGFHLKAWLGRHAEPVAGAIEETCRATRPRIVLCGDPSSPALALPWECYGELGSQPFLDGRAQLVRLLDGPRRDDLALDIAERLVVTFAVGELEQVGGMRPSSATADVVRDALDFALHALAEWPGQVTVRIVACGASAAALGGSTWSDQDLEFRSETPDASFEHLVTRSARDSHVVHWIGHSDAAAGSPATALITRPADGPSRAMPLGEFGKLLVDGGGTTRLLVLHSCWTDPSGAAALLAHVPHVLAMQAMPGLRFADEFHRALYGVLLQPRRGGVPAAFAELCRALDPSIAWIPAQYAVALDSRGLVDIERQTARKYDDALVARLETLPETFERLLRGGRVRSRVFIGLDLHGADERSCADDPLRMVERRLPARGGPERDTLVKVIARARTDARLRRLVLRGDAGQGKTTLLKDAGCEFVRAGWTVVFARVADLIVLERPRGGAPRLVIRSCLATKGKDLALAPDLDAKRAKKAIAERRFLLLLDGLDEVPSALRPGIADAMQEVDRDLGEGIAVVASRRSTHDKAPAPYREVVIAGLAADDKRELVGKWYAELWHRAEDPLRFGPLRSTWTSPAAATDAFVSALDKHPPLDQTTNDPLALTLAALWFAEKGGKIASDASFQRRDLLRKFVDGLLEASHRDEAQRPFTGEAVHVARAAARFLALWMLKHGQGRRLELGEDVDDLHEGDALGTALRNAVTANFDPRLAAWQERWVGKPSDISRPWRWSGGDPEQPPFLLELKRTELFVPLDSSQRVWHFPLASLQDVLAAEALAVRAGLATPEGQTSRGAGEAKAVARLLDDLRKLAERASERINALGEALALLEAWIGDEEQKAAWLVGLHDIDARIGLRALGLAHRPPASAVAKLLARAETEEKLEFWDGLIARVEDPKIASAVIRAAVPGLTSGVDRFAMEEVTHDLVAKGSLGTATGQKLVSSVRFGRSTEELRLDPLAKFPGKGGGPLWERIDAERIGWSKNVFGVGDELTPMPVPQPFWMMAVPVTAEMYALFDAEYSVRWRGEDHPIAKLPPSSEAAFDQKNRRFTNRHPAVVTWFEAVAFTRWLNAVALPRAKDLLGCEPPVGWRFRLPTELEWEWACRAGTTTKFWCGKKLAREYAWFAEGDEGATHPVGLLRANDFGLRDMHGNQWEWCVDGWDQAIEPSGRLSWRGSGRVLRGGSCWFAAVHCRSACRNGVGPAFRFDFIVDADVGFRPVLAAPLPSSGSVIEDR
ncbi:MAG: SUMF1/EgtB/PvdO family nonheme iron enzyme [Planctomycetes bacterium]|nr:SUMF1/EgtB/PvdO family nonheme iron enzyme [Planctomycetota bacterium]